ncbi:hypothetical protein KFL_000690210 [Klebsormidium nitens]|uniref:Uncharacterized protein n=1 Tax=Klebsormidium nitens TaxID=105231 RepID=A0A1Y1HT91_KLENI|nr:hypothetical protein KFL_000690210 [Klebsormidium nitens]|eukprot:GAQ81042.1 hypothetical protein KFL_000690210 [Klebsormidium nitens]
MDEYEDTLLVLVNQTLDLMWPLALFFILLLTYPPLAVWRCVRWLFTFPWPMQDRVVLITGASSGIGEHIAYEYARLGARLALVARREERLEEVEDNCKSLGSPDVQIIQADVSKEEDCKQVVEETVQHFQRLDTLLLNAGVAHIYSFEEADDTKGFGPIMDVNFWGYVYTTKFALPHLRRSQGQIVVNDSIVSFLPQAKTSIYNASKAAVSQFFETLRVELGSAVPITVFLPGAIKSEMTDGKVLLPDGKVASPDEAFRLRNEAGFGLFPLLPTSALARRVVKAARYRRPRVVIPSWYKTMFYLKIFEPELLYTSLRIFWSGRPSFAKRLSEIFGGGIKPPGPKEFERGGFRKDE